jgi:hypothetical protein
MKTGSRLLAWLILSVFVLTSWFFFFHPAAESQQKTQMKESDPRIVNRGRRPS